MSSPVTGFTQDNRFLSITTPLGKDALLLASLVGTEAISAPFRFDVELMSDRVAKIDLKQLVGQKVTITIADAAGKPRYINGVVSSASQGGADDVFKSYRAEIVPTFALLRHRVDVRIFQRKSVTDIIEQVFKDAGLADYQLQTNATYAPLDYCVQYNESDFVFVSRLMEEHGIFYFFQHEKTKHTLVLADQSSAHKPCPGQTEARYQRTTGGALADDVVNAWETRREFRSGKVTLTDYNFETPSSSLLVNDPTTVRIADNDKYELYAYPGEYAKKADGDTLARLRMQAEEVNSVVVAGGSTCRTFASGYRFTLTEHFDSTVNGDYVLTEVSHSASAGSYARDASDHSDAHYSNRFTCIPFATPYRPDRLTPRPVVHGVQPALVVGEGGEEIWVDKYGRVKVQFFWDRAGKKNDQSSCWVRVAQPWAGKQWGFVQLPRIGQEVLVAFEEGNPDRPIIVGSVYNAEQMPPYALPDNQTQSGIKTRSSKGGGAENFNELRFEDKKGSEEVHLQAEKDLTGLVKNDETWTVDHDRTTTIKNDDTRTVSEGNDATTVTKGNQTVDIDKGNQTTTLGQGNQVADIKMGNHEVTLEQGNQTVEVKMGNQTIKLGMGNQSTKLDLGSVSTEAMQGIELKVGQSSVKIDQMGVTITGMMIKIEGQVQTEVKGLITQISADAMLAAKGAITMIN
jgi:type VI secretion system secreted protein VgrG